MTTPTLKVVCAWCNRTVIAAPKGAPVTHTICPACLDWTFTHPGFAIRPGASRDVDELTPSTDYFGDPFKH